MRSEIISHDGRLYHLGITADDVARNVFLVGDPERASLVASRFDTIGSEVRSREFVTITGRCRGVHMSVIGTGIGTDNVEIALIELDAAHRMGLADGARAEALPPIDLIRVGTSGGVQSDIAAGTLCIADYALGLDATGLYYEEPMLDDVASAIENEAGRALGAASAGAQRFGGRLPVYTSRAHPDVTAALVEAASSHGAAFQTGITASSPGFFGPSSRFIEGLTNTVPDIKATLAGLAVGAHRVINMEMESSLLFHLARALGHRAGTICPAISQPGAPDVVVNYAAAVDAAIDIAMAAMLRLASAGE